MILVPLWMLKRIEHEEGNRGGDEPADDYYNPVVIPKQVNKPVHTSSSSCQYPSKGSCNSSLCLRNFIACLSNFSSSSVNLSSPSVFIFTDLIG